ncbi:MAG: zinc-ribbon domain-containing protein, partial [Candidatus Limnocylindrales bacterium]
MIAGFDHDNSARMLDHASVLRTSAPYSASRQNVARGFHRSARNIRAMSEESSGLLCPRCETPVTADARFCMSCGQPLADGAADDSARQARISAAAPQPLVEKMRTAKLTGERKPVTALFADVVGSTT